MSAAAASQTIPAGNLKGAPMSALSAELKQATGYTVGQLENRPACESPNVSQIVCRAEVLTVKSTGRAVSLRARPTATPQTFRAVRGSAIHADTFGPDGANPPAVAAPQAFTPAYLQWAYDLTWLAGETPNNGTRDTIAVVDAFDDPNAEADMSQFRQEYGLWPCATTLTASDCLTEIENADIFAQYNGETGAAIDVSGSGSAPPVDQTGGWEVEESLDIDSISSLCPHCSIDLVESDPGSCVGPTGNCTYPQFDANLATAAATADSLHPNQISMSFGEADYEGCDTGTWWFTGVSSLAAAGDYGYQGSSTYLHYCNESANLPTVSYPAAHNQVTAVGGTTLAPADNPRGFSESVWNDGYIPGQQPYEGYYEGTESGCDTSQAVPSYQVGIATNCAGRAYNDISADADPASGLAVYDSFGGNDDDAYGCDTVGNPGSCIVGGTSLATPLTAAYEALAGITPTDSPTWAYTNASYLNDITSGGDESNLSCLSAQVVICDAAAGWDGPTGNGSIEGDVQNGAPGIGGTYANSVTPDGTGTYDASLEAGVYLNNQAITDAFPPAPATPTAGIQWEYGPTTAYGNVVLMPGQPTGSDPATVTTTLTGLNPCAIYHFRLDANNVDATTYGYDSTLLTVDPTITGTPTQGQTLTSQLGQSGCDVTYQWEESGSPSGTFTKIPGATSSTYVMAHSDVGDYIELVVTLNDTDGTATAASPVVGPVAALPSGGQSTDPTTTTTTPTTTQTTPTTTTTTTVSQTTNTTTTGPHQPVVLKAPTITSASQVGGVISVNGGSYAYSTGTLIQFFRCAHVCTLLSTYGASRYTLTAADAGHYIDVKLTVYGAAGTVPLSSTNWIGPVSATRAGALTVTMGARIASVQRVHGTTGLTLATVRMKRRTTKSVRLAISSSATTPTSAWVCLLSGGVLDSCTVAHTVKGTTNLNVGFQRGQTLKVIAVSAAASTRARK